MREVKRFSTEDVHAIMRKALLPKLDTLSIFKREGERIWSDKIREIADAKLSILMSAAKDIDLVIREMLMEEIKSQPWNS